MNTLVALFLLWVGWLCFTFGLLVWHSQRYMDRNRSSVPYSRTYLDARWWHAMEHSAMPSRIAFMICAAVTFAHAIKLM